MSYLQVLGVVCLAVIFCLGLYLFLTHGAAQPKRFADGGVVGTNVGELPVVIQTGLDLPRAVGHLGDPPHRNPNAPPGERFTGMSPILGMGYDPSVFDDQRELGEAETRAKLNEFRKMHPEIADYWHRVADPMVENVVAKFRSRSRVGTEKYGTTLDTNPAPFDEWVVHLQEELMDAANYCETLLARHHKFNSERSLLQSAFDLMLAENKELCAHITLIEADNANLVAELTSLHNALAGEP